MTTATIRDKRARYPLWIYLTFLAYAAALYWVAWKFDIVGEFAIPYAGPKMGRLPNGLSGGYCWFGYDLMLYWSLSTIVLFPVMASCSITGLSMIFSASFGRGHARASRRSVVALVFAFGGWAIWRVGLQMRHGDLNDSQKDWGFCQWNDYHAQCLAQSVRDHFGAYTWLLRHPANVLYYVVYLAFYALIGATIAFVVFAPRDWSDRAHEVECALSRSTTVSVLAQLAHLVLVRVTKVYMVSARAEAERLKQLCLPREHASELVLWTQWKPYTDAIPRELIFSIFEAISSIVLLLVIRGLIDHRKHGELQRGESGVEAISIGIRVVSLGARQLGRPAWAAIGACFVLIAVPPPTIAAFFIVVLLMVGTALMRYGLKGNLDLVPPGMK